MPDKPSLAREFFERVVGAAAPVTAIRKLCDPSDPQFETDYLDFKKYDPKSLKDQFRQALCGFSNNQGGVLIWGIDARPTGDPPVDAACAEAPVAHPHAIKSRLLELQNGGVDPPVANVRMEAIETAPGSGVGFLIAYIPEGAFKPYRATDGSQAFWFRSGWSFVPMATSMIRQLFYPRSQPVLQAVGHVHLSATVRRSEHLRPGNNACRVDLEVSLENIGGGTAKGTYIELSVVTRGELNPSMELGKGWRMNAGSAPLYFFRSRRQIHPRQLVCLMWIDWEIPTGQKVHEWLGRVLQLRMVIYSENQEPQKFFAEVDTTRMLEIGGGFALNFEPVEAFPPWPREYQ